MGGSMSRIAPGIYVGGLVSAKSKQQLKDNNITHMCTVLHQDFETELVKQKRFLAEDSPAENLRRYFEDACMFIHEARCSGGSVLIHCACGVSRSVTLTLAYLLTITDFSLSDLMDAVRGARHHACPNSGFMSQLVQFHNSGDHKRLRQRLVERFGEWPSEKQLMDTDELKANIAVQLEYVKTGVYSDDPSARPEASEWAEGLDCPQPKPLDPSRYFIFTGNQPNYLSNSESTEPDKVDCQSNETESA